MMRRRLPGAMVVSSAVCPLPVTVPVPQPEARVCQDMGGIAAAQASALARFRGDLRAVILLPSGEGTAGYEAATRRLQSEDARLRALLKAGVPDTDTKALPRPVFQETMTEAEVAAGIADADACLATVAE